MSSRQSQGKEKPARVKKAPEAEGHIKCHLCGKGFFKKMALSRHMAWKHPPDDGAYKCKSCSFSGGKTNIEFPSELSFNLISHSAHTPGSLSQHVAFKHKNRCPRCDLPLEGGDKKGKNGEASKTPGRHECAAEFGPGPPPAYISNRFKPFPENAKKFGGRHIGVENKNKVVT